MPTDKIRPPGQYPREFNNALLFRGQGWGYEIARGGHTECLAVARKFRAFMAACSQYPLSASGKAAKGINARTVVKLTPSGVYICLIVVSPKETIEAALQSALAK